MSSAWLLPEHFADVLPSQARQIEDLRRVLLDAAHGYGYELVIPPILEFTDSLLSGPARTLDLRTFKLVDQLSGRTMGLRSDTTLQAARIDAHLLNRVGVTRLCYCGPVVHARSVSFPPTREPLQFGAEIYGHPGLEAELESIELALDCARRAGSRALTIDLGDARILQDVCAPGRVPDALAARLREALAGKDQAAVLELARSMPEPVRKVVEGLPRLYGDVSVLAQAQADLGSFPLARTALQDLQWLVDRIRRAHPDVAISVDLGDPGGNAYYSGVRFAVFGEGAPAALIRGGRYDEVGSAFGRNRPAVGFSLDVKALVEWAPSGAPRQAIRAPWDDSSALRHRVRELRGEGHTVLSVLPGHEDETEEYSFDRELVERDGQWVVQPL